MSGNWQAGNVREFFEELRREQAKPYRLVEHSFITPKHIPWLTYCRRCGLGLLKNDVSQKCKALGCEYKKSPWYARWKRGGYKIVDGRPQT